MIKVMIEVDKNINQIEKIFKPELKKTINERAFFSIEKKNKKLVFQVKSKDVVALRAILNSITKLLEVNDKINKLE